MSRFLPVGGWTTRRPPLAAGLCLAAALSAGAAYAVAHAAPSRPGATTPVTTCADDGGAGTLRTIAGNAASGDTVDLRQLECGVIVLTGGEIETAADDLVVAGPGREALTIDGGDAGRIFRHSGRGTLALHDVTLAHGRVVDGNGGCVSSSRGSIALVDATVAHCTAHDASGQSDHAGGGGLFAGGDVSLLRSTLRDSTASADAARAVGGGGLLTRFDADGAAGNVEVTDSTIRGNRVLSAGAGDDVVARGGGIDSSGTVTLVRSVVSENAVSSASIDDVEESVTEGGGVHAFGLHVVDSAFVGNRVDNTGGALDVAGGAIAVLGTAVVLGTTIEGNHAGMAAGGVLQGGGVPGVSRLDMLNSTLSRNTAGFYGAGLVATSQLTLTSSTVAFNAVDDASPFGIGGVLIGSNETTGAYAIRSSIISDNQASSESPWGADLAVFMAEAPITIAGARNLVGQASGLILPDDTLGGDPRLLPLADNGGPTRTHALAPGSPAIDAGDNAAGLDFDQRGANFPRVAGAAADIGAFEVQDPGEDTIFGDGFEEIAAGRAPAG